MDQHFWKATLVGTAFAGVVLASINVTAAAVQFKAPGDSVPRTSVGGGTRAKVQFALPGRSRQPKTSIGGGTRAKVKFALPGRSHQPKTSIGGGTRAKVKFALPGRSRQPKTSVGGGTRAKVKFALPDRSRRPKTSVGSGSRGSDFPLTALLPTTNHGRTISARPTIFAYLPPLGAEDVFFSLQDQEGHSHYHTTLRVPATGGIIGVTLPPTALALETGKNYLWYFAPIEPGGILRPDNLAVAGWVKRVETNLNRPVSSPIQLATEYAGAGIWYDTLNVLAQAQQSQPGNLPLKTEWQDLLAQVGLDKFSAEPIAMVSSS